MNDVIIKWVIILKNLYPSMLDKIISYKSLMTVILRQQEKLMGKTLKQTEL